MTSVPLDLAKFLPSELKNLGDPQTAIPKIAKNVRLLGQIDAAVATLPTHHEARIGDARDLSFIPDESVHLVVTSPPYWTLKEYNASKGQMGAISDYEDFLTELDKVWAHAFRVLVPGGRLICVVGDVCLSRKRNGGRHTVVPLHASIQERCRKIGFDNLSPIIWHKIANAVYEVDEPHFPVFEEFKEASYAKRYELLCLKLVREGLYDSASFMVSNRSAEPGAYREPNQELAFRAFAASLVGCVSAALAAE